MLNIHVLLVKDSNSLDVDMFLSVMAGSGKIALPPAFGILGILKFLILISSGPVVCVSYMPLNLASCGLCTGLYITVTRVN